MAHANPTERQAVADLALAESPSLSPAQIQRNALQLAVAGRDFDTLHFFVPGMYCRVVARKAGVAIIGKQHKAAHFYIVCKGSVEVHAPDGSRRVFNAGDVVVSQPGTQRAVVALEDSICLTVHRTDLTDLDAIEAELIEPDADALFDARNQRRPEVIQ